MFAQHVTISHLYAETLSAARSYDYDYWHFPIYAVSRYVSYLKKTEEMTRLKRTLNSSARDWKHSEMKVVEEYYWAITNAAADQVSVLGS
jgi:hypothetical protein